MNRFKICTYIITYICNIYICISRCGADPNITSKKGLSPLHEAMLIGDRDMILTILEADNLDMKAKTKKEYTHVSNSTDHNF